MRTTLLVVILFVALPFNCHTQFPIYNYGKNELYDSEINVDSYKFRYTSADGFTSREESGGFENDVWTVKGKVSWTSPEGRTFSYEYIADANGYRQTGVPPAPSRPVYYDSPAAFPAIKDDLLLHLADSGLAVKKTKA